MTKGGPGEERLRASTVHLNVREKERLLTEFLAWPNSTWHLLQPLRKKLLIRASRDGLWTSRRRPRLVFFQKVAIIGSEYHQATS